MARYPKKYGKDHGEHKGVGQIACDLCELIKNAGDYREYLDREFFWGAWGDAIDMDSIDPDFRRDIGSIIKFVYLAARGLIDEYDRIYKESDSIADAKEKIARLLKP